MSSYNFSKTSVLIIGDIMLDRYCFGATQRISPEAPVPVVQMIKQEDKPGGAGNVAVNVAALGAQAELISVIGADEAGQVLQKELSALSVTTQLIIASNYATTVKQRVLSQNQQLMRLDIEQSLDIAQIKDQILSNYQQALTRCDIVIISDYAKGVIAELAPELISLAKQKNLPVLVDPKHDDFSLYAHATLLTPNYKEFEAAVGKVGTEHEIVQRAQQILTQCDLSGLLVTRGPQGMMLCESGQPEYYLPAKGREVFDVTGAGDTVISVIAVALAAGWTMMQAVELGNTAAGIVIGKLGAGSVTVDELKYSNQAEQQTISGVVTESVLLANLEIAKAQGKKIVFTNGCFDVLHAMHVEYLSLAAQQGDYLVVAVNSDDSIRRLKGEGRPINQAKHRMAVLAGLAAVDCVLEFTDDTPCRLLKLVRPDILAKGGDYTADQILGTDIVEQYGGSVVVLGGVEAGVKSTAIIERMRKLSAQS